MSWLTQSFVTGIKVGAFATVVILLWVATLAAVGGSVIGAYELARHLCADAPLLYIVVVPIELCILFGLGNIYLNGMVALWNKQWDR